MSMLVQTLMYDTLVFHLCFNSNCDIFMVNMQLYPKTRSESNLKRLLQIFTYRKKDNFDRENLDTFLLSPISETDF